MNKTALLAIMAAAAGLAALTLIPVSANFRDKERQCLQAQIRLRDDFIRQHLDTLFSLKDEFVLNDSNEHTIHALDSLGLKFATDSKSIDYYRYALDINYLQEQLRNN